MNRNHATMHSPAVYRIRVQGLVPLGWSSRLLGMNITTSGEPGSERTTIVGRLPDQTALSGIFNTLHETGYPVLSLECLELD